MDLAPLAFRKKIHEYDSVIVFTKGLAMHRFKLKTLLFTLHIIFLTFLFHTADACTRILYANPGLPILVGNNMDWFEDMETNLWVYPRGIKRSSMTNDNPMTWVSKYGSIIASYHDKATTNGMNERGLAVHLLGLNNSDYGTRDPSRPGLFILQWAQFYLDNFASVAEAVEFTEHTNMQLVSYYDPSMHNRVELHMALEDASGDSAIIEYTDGTPHIYHNSFYKVLTNTPAYNLQLENLKNYAGFGGNLPLPGTTDSKDRFVRASFYLSHLPERTNTRDAIMDIFSVLQNAGQPFGVVSPEREHMVTSIWRTVSDLTNKTYYFQSTTSFYTFWAQLDKFNLAAGAPILKLDIVHHPDLAGDVTNQFKPVA